MSNPLIPFFAKEHPGETFEVDDVNEWVIKEITRLRSDLVDTKVLLDNAIFGSAYRDSMLDDCDLTIKRLSEVIQRYAIFLVDRELPANIDIDTAIKARDAAIEKVRRLESIISVFCENVREELL